MPGARRTPRRGRGGRLRLEGGMLVSRALEDGFGDILRKARFGLGLDQTKLAEITGLTADTINRFEAGLRTPTDAEAERLARALGLGVEAFKAIIHGWVPPEIDTGPYAVRTFRFASMDSNGYLVTGGGIATSLFVDPGDRPDELIAACIQSGGLDAVLVTHSHSDHVQALPELVNRFPEALVVGHEKALRRLALPGEVKAVAVTRDERVPIGSFELEVWESPGHSDDGVVFIAGNIAFTGDTLFAGSLGRSAQGPVTYERLLRSAQRLLALDERTVLLPGHGPVTTVALESVHNPFLAREGR